MGKKIRLEMESVRVESFETADTPRVRGTVRGQITVNPGTCLDTDCTCDTDCQCSGQWTCPGGQVGTCDGGSTCYDTCHTGVCICF